MVNSSGMQPSAVMLNKHQKEDDDTTTAADATSRQRVRRLYWSIGASSVAVLVIVVAIIAPIVALQNADRSAEKLNTLEERNAANDFSREFRNNLISASSATYSLAGFVAGMMQKAPPFNASIAERVAGQNFSNFAGMCAHANASSANLVLMLSAPGGVIYQVVPPFPELELIDILNSPYGGSSGFGDDSGEDSGSAHPTDNPFASLASTIISFHDGDDPTTTMPPDANAGQDCSMVNWPSPFETLSCGGVSMLGPTRVVADAMIGPDWFINLRFPLFVSMDPADSTTSNFWGFIYSVLSITKAVRVNNLTSEMHNRHMRYLMYTVNRARIVPISTSLSPATSQAEFLAFISRSTVLPIIPDGPVSWFIAVESTRNEDRADRRTVSIVVCCVIFGTLVLLVVALVLIFRCTAEYNGRRYAPKACPFALVTIGPYNGKELWDLAADEMVTVTDSLNSVLDAAMVRAKAYRVQQMHPFTASYVLHRVEDAVTMCFGILEEIHKNRVDGPLVRLLGEEERLMLAFALHWCEEASVVAKDGIPPQYSGPDVRFNARMWVFAAPNTVTMSSTAKQQFSLHRTGLSKGIKVRFLNSVFLRGVRHRQDLYNATDDSNERVREAGQVAAARVRRIREAQQRRRQQEPGERRRGRGRPLTSPDLDDSGKRSLATFPLLGESAARASRSSVPPDHDMMRLAITTAVLGGAGPIASGDSAVVGAGTSGTVGSTAALEESLRSSSSPGHSRLRSTRANPLALSHPLLYYRHDVRGHLSSSSGASGTGSGWRRHVGSGRGGGGGGGGGGASSRYSSSRHSSTDGGASSASSDSSLREPVPRASRTPSSSVRSPVDGVLSPPMAGLVGHVSGGLVVPASVHSVALDRSPPSMTTLGTGPTTGTVPAVLLRLDSPKSLLDADVPLPQITVSHVVPPSLHLPRLSSPLLMTAAGVHGGGAARSMGPSSRSRSSSAPAESRSSSSHSSDSSFFTLRVTARQATSQPSRGEQSITLSPTSLDTGATTVAPPDSSLLMTADAPFSGPATTATTPTAAGDGRRRTARAASLRTEALPGTVTIGPGGRFMIAPPTLATRQRPSAIKARREQQTQRLRDPLHRLPSVAVHDAPTTVAEVDPAELYPIARSTELLPATQHHGSLSTTAVVVAASGGVSPMENILSLVPSSSSSVCSSSRGNSGPQARAGSGHARPRRFSVKRDAEKTASTSAASASEEAIHENPLSGGGAVAAAAASTSRAPAFPIVLGSSAVRVRSTTANNSSSHSGSGSSANVSRTPSGLRAHVDEDRDDGSAVYPLPTTTVHTTATATAGLGSTSPSSGSSSPALSANRRGQSTSHITNVTSSVPFAASTKTRDSELAVALLRAITHPSIPDWLDQQLRDSFEQQSVALDVSYDSLRIIIYYVYFGCKLLMRPLSPAQRTSIYRRLVGNVGVPQQSAMVYLSTRCVVQFVQQHEEQHSLLWDRQLQLEQNEQQSKAR